jgi:hypothetical protein
MIVVEHFDSYAKRWAVRTMVATGPGTVVWP